MKPRHLVPPALLNNTDHGLTSSLRAHIPVVMGYGELDINPPELVAEVLSTDRRQIISLCKGDSSKAHHLSRGP
jgi:hypothetical protein